MKKTAMIVLVLTGILFIVLLQNNKRAGQNAQAPITQTWEARIDEQGSVIIEAQPVELSKTATVWKFKVAMNTHSVELDQDMVLASALADNTGIESKAISWEGDPGGGHHREGILSFKPIVPWPKSLELRVKNVGAVSERIFKWDLN